MVTSADRYIMTDAPHNGNGVVVEVQIATLGTEGLARAGRMALPAVEGVVYTVGVQGCPVNTQIPQSLRRPDIKVVQTPGVGLSVNRNSLLAIRRGDVIVFGDDDLHYSADGLAALRAFYISNPQVSILTFKLVSKSTVYGDDVPHALSATALRFRYSPSCAISVKSNAVGNTLFCEKMGVGNHYVAAGEEDIFLYTLLCKGFHGVYQPIEVAEHSAKSSGENNPTPESMRARGAVLSVIYRFSWPMHFLFAACRFRGLGFCKNLVLLFQGRRFARDNGLNKITPGRPPRRR